MTKFNPPTIKQRVKTTILPAPDAKQEVELDYRMFVVGDFSGKEQGSQGLLKDRKVWQIRTKRDLKTVMTNVNPKLDLVVRNRLVDDPEARMEVHLDLQSMKDFHPDEIVKKVEPLKDLVKTRDNLSKLRLKVMNKKMRDEIQELLKRRAIDQLIQNLDKGDSKES